MSRRLTMEPPRSWATMMRLPSRSPKPRMSSSVSSLVAMLRTTSRSLITGGGLKKCVPTTRSGRVVARAISMMGSDDVLVIDPELAGREQVGVRLGDDGAKPVSRRHLGDARAHEAGAH